MRTWSNNSVIFTSGTIAGVILALGLTIFAWTGPTSSPPNGNVAAPVNVGTTDQVKNGGLGVNSLAVFGNTMLSGTDRYLNFGTTAGVNGYGIRDNGGTIQVKNSGGAWTNLGQSSQWVTSGSEIYYATGNVGIGVTDPTRELDVAGGVSANIYYDRGYPSYYLDASHTSRVYQLYAASLCIGGVCKASWPALASYFWQDCQSSWADGLFGKNASNCSCSSGSVMVGIYFYAYDHMLLCQWLQ